MSPQHPLPDRALPRKLARLALLMILALGSFSAGLLVQSQWKAGPTRISGAERPPLTRSPEKPNVLLVSFDTLRADFLGCYGDDKSLTPNLDRFAESSVLFEAAYCAVPFTAPSLWSLLRSIRIHDFTYETVLRAEWPGASIAEIASQHGYLTAAFTGHPALNRGVGYDNGFSFFFDTGEKEFSQHNDYVVERVARFVESALSHSRTPFFIYVHFFDPHTPWQKDLRVSRTRAGGMTSPFKMPDEEAIPAPPDMTLQDTYRRRITWSDEAFGELEDLITQSGLADTTYVIATADHGVAFSEHGQAGYAFSLYDDVARIPLIVRTPRHEARRVSSPVSLVDLGPTLLDLMGIANRHADGVSSRPLLEGKPTGSSRPVYAETVAIRPDVMATTIWDNALSRYAPGVENIHSALIVDNLKLLHIPARRGQKYELYDLAADPTEQNNIFNPQDPSHVRMAGQLLAMRYEQKANGRTVGDEHDRDEVMDRLKALGYVE